VQSEGKKGLSALSNKGLQVDVSVSGITRRVHYSGC